MMISFYTSKLRYLRSDTKSVVFSAISHLCMVELKRFKKWAHHIYKNSEIIWNDLIKGIKLWFKKKQELNTKHSNLKSNDVLTEPRL